MKRQGVGLCALFFLVGCLWGMKTEFGIIQRTGHEATWAMLLQPASLVNVLTMGVGALVALLTKSPLTTKLLMKTIGMEGEPPAEPAEKESGIEAASIATPSKQALHIEIIE